MASSPNHSVAVSRLTRLTAVDRVRGARVALALVPIRRFRGVEQPSRAQRRNALPIEHECFGLLPPRCSDTLQLDRGDRVAIWRARIFLAVRVGELPARRRWLPDIAE